LKSDSDAKFQTITGMSNYYIKSQIDDKFQPYATQAGLMLLLSAYPTFGYSNANYQLKSDMINYFTALQITDSYYDKWTVDNYIDAKIDATYVLEMMYNEMGHQYFIAVDSTTSTTDAQFIINNDQKTPLIKFSTTGTAIYTGNGYNAAFINASNNNAIATVDPTNINHCPDRYV